jgi:hypothetical protein
MHRLGGRRGALALLALSVTGANACDGIVSPATCSPPVILQSSVRSNPDNVISAIVSARVVGADSLYVKLGAANGSRNDSTPAVAAGDTAQLSVFGLLPQARYELQLIAVNSCAFSAGTVLEFATDSLPHDLPAFRASGSDPSPGYVVFAAGSFGVVIDNSGRVCGITDFLAGQDSIFSRSQTANTLRVPLRLHRARFPHGSRSIPTVG